MRSRVRAPVPVRPASEGEGVATRACCGVRHTRRSLPGIPRAPLASMSIGDPAALDREGGCVLLLAHPASRIASRMMSAVRGMSLTIRPFFVSAPIEEGHRPELGQRHRLLAHLCDGALHLLQHVLKPRIGPDCREDPVPAERRVVFVTCGERPGEPVECPIVLASRGRNRRDLNGTRWFSLPLSSALCARARASARSVEVQLTMTVSGVAGAILRSVDEEPLSIPGHGVRLVGADHTRRKKRLWHSREGLGRVDRHGRHRPVRGEI